MRRSDREVTDKNEIIEIIEKCDICHLALSDNNVPYVIPLNFGYMYTDERLTLYFHGAAEGRKLEIISRNPFACFQMDCSHNLIQSEDACSYTMAYESVIGNGRVSICADSEEKIKALTLLMKTYVKNKTFTFSEQQAAAVAIFRLDVSDFTGKRLKTRVKNPPSV